MTCRAHRNKALLIAPILNLASSARRTQVSSAAMPRAKCRRERLPLYKAAKDMMVVKWNVLRARW